MDLDFIAAFDYTVLEWVLMVLEKKGLSENVINRIRNTYANRITVPVVNNVAGKGVKNIRGTLAQGCPSSMNWFGYAIDPLLEYLAKRLQGIPIISLPVSGPQELGKPRPEPLTEKYKVFGLADDVKPSVSSMSEFAIVDRGATLFERSSGNQLHRDPVRGKCKVLLLGRWKGTVSQEDIGFPHLRITDSLAFVGVHLQATWVQTRKENNDELMSRFKATVGSWKAGKFMPLICRPFSMNSYALSKLWFRTHSVDLRAGDISTINSTCKGYLYQDMLEKPSELVLFRKVEDGGLGLHNAKYKALASLIATFLQTAANDRYQQSLFHNTLYRCYCLEDDSIDKPSMPPYYNETFFNTIRKVIKETPLNPIYMSIKQWYDYLLEEFFTMETVDEEGRQLHRKSRVEQLHPNNNWSRAFSFARLKGLSMEIRSFNFKLLHQILPFRERLSYILRGDNQPECVLCPERVPETSLHGLFSCSRNLQASEEILRLTRIYDQNISAEKILLFDINTVDSIYELPVMLVISTGLSLIWKNRQDKKATTLYQIRTELECLISLLRRSRTKLIREAGNMISNTLVNF